MLTQVWELVCDSCGLVWTASALHAALEYARERGWELRRGGAWRCCHCREKGEPRTLADVAERLNG